MNLHPLHLPSNQMKGVWYRRILTVAAALMVFSPAWAQWEEVWQTESRAKFVRMDNLNHLYAVGETEIIKYGAYGEVLYRYSDNPYGSIGDMDASNALRTLVFYPDLGTVLLLDNTLSEFRGPIDLREKGLDHPVAVCTSVQNHFWVFDGVGSKLVRLSDRFDKVVETGNLAQILRTTLEPEFMREVGDRLYLNDPKTGVYVFDLYGSYIKTIPIAGMENFSVMENSLLYLENDSLRRYDTRMHAEVSMALPQACRRVTLHFPTVGALCGDRLHYWRWRGE